MAEWLRGDLRDYTREVLLDPITRSREMFRPDAVGALIDEHVGGQADHSQGLWTLLVLELWQREFVDSPRGAVTEQLASP